MHDYAIEVLPPRRKQIIHSKRQNSYESSSIPIHASKMTSSNSDRSPEQKIAMRMMIAALIIMMLATG